MRLRLDIDLDRLSSDPAREVGRILRYWGSNMSAEPLEPGVAQDLYDSTYAGPVGRADGRRAEGRPVTADDREDTG